MRSNRATLKKTNGASTINAYTVLVSRLEQRKTMPLYTTIPAGINHNDASSAPIFSTRVQSFYRWIYKLSRQEGYCWASTPYLATKQRASERTIYRWLARLADAGYIRHEVDCGIERRITPLKTPEPIRGTRHRFIQTHKPDMQNVRGKHGKLDTGRVRGLPYDAYTQETTTRKPGAGTQNAGGKKEFPAENQFTVKPNDATQPCHHGGERALIPLVPKHSSKVPRSHTLLRSSIAAKRSVQNELPPAIENNTPAAFLVATLEHLGVTRVKAVELVQSYEYDVITKQIAALNYRKAKDRAAVLVASIKQNWSIPAAVSESIKQRVQDERKAHTSALSAALERERQSNRANTLAAFSGQSDAICSHWRERAAVVLRSEYSNVVGMMSNRAMWSGMIERRASELWASSSPPE